MAPVEMCAAGIGRCGAILAENELSGSSARVRTAGDATVFGGGGGGECRGQVSVV